LYEEPLKPGEIVTAHVLDVSGRAVADRPCVVISGGADGFELEDDDEAIFLVAITHKVDKIPDEDRVPLPYMNGRRHPVPGLEGESAAHCGWQVYVTRHNILGTRGHAPAAEFAVILQRLRALGVID
jgi:hypothetical protein